MFDRRTLEGAAFACGAYFVWGLAPIYFKALTATPTEILAHRVLWSLLLLALLLATRGGFASLRIEPRKLLTLFATTCLLGANWLLFIQAVVDDQIVEASLGYFINPLVSVLLGYAFLGERLRTVQYLAIAIAGVGISIPIVLHGSLPIIALALAFSFGLYGLLRKRLALPSVTGLLLETLIACPFALGYLVWLAIQGRLVFGHQGLEVDLLLAAAGLITSIPLLCFASAVNRLSLAAMGMFQYLSPSLSLLVAVFGYGESFGIERQATFGCIWAALALFTAETLHRQHRLHRNRGL